MAHVLITITEVIAGNQSGANDTIRITGKVFANNAAASASGYTVQVYCPFDASSEDLNAAYIAEALDVIDNAGYPAGANDVVRLVGGAMPRL